SRRADGSRVAGFALARYLLWYLGLPEKSRQGDKWTRGKVEKVGEFVSRADALRDQIRDLVQQYHQERFANRTFDPRVDLVHYAGRVLAAAELWALVDASLDFFLTANRYAERFEAEFADLLGVSNALLVNSGSSANLVALTTLTSPMLGERRLRPGDEVVTV